MPHIIIWCRNHPVIVLFSLLFISFYFLFQVVNKIEVDASIDGMIIRSNPDYFEYQETKTEFITDNISVVYIKDQNIFSHQKLLNLEKIFYQLEDISGVVRIDGIFNAKSFNGSSGTLEIDPLIPYIPDENEIADLNKIKKNAIHNPLLLKNLVSSDGTVIVINILVENTKNEKDFNMRVAHDIENVVKNLKGKVEKAFQIGTPYRRDLISKSILNDLSKLIPLAVITISIILVLVLKSFNGAFIPLLTGGLSILWTLGFMVLMGIPINILTAIVPPMLLTLGCTEDIHIISEYFEGLDRGLSRFDAIEFMAPQVGNAILLTSITTFLGCLSIAFNDIDILKQFGIAASFGIAVNFIITVTFIPVFLKYFGNNKKPKLSRYLGRFVHYYLPGILCNIILNHKKTVIFLTVIIVIICSLGIPAVRVDNNLIGYFKKSTPIRVRSMELNRKIAGSEIFYLVLTANQQGAFRKPEYLKMILDIQNYLKNNCGFDFSLSLADHVALIERENNLGKKEYYRIPDSEDIIAQHLLFFHSFDLDRYVNYEYNKVNIIVRHSISSSYDLKKILDKLEFYIKDKYSDKITYLLTGENILLLRAADSMAFGLIKSLSFMFIFIFILISTLFQDFKLGLISLIPNTLPILMIFGVMGYLNIPLNTGTTMIAVISIGVAVDDTIHLMTRFKQVSESIENLPDIIQSVISSEIKPMFASSIALMVGFFVLSQSSFLPIAHFGILSGLVIIFAFFADLVITPISIAILYRFNLINNGR